MPGAIPARHLVIEIADFHNKIGQEQTPARSGPRRVYLRNGLSCVRPVHHVWQRLFATLRWLPALFFEQFS